jgi:hypothetical protein
MDINQRVAKICLQHPFSSSVIILGHLEAQNIHIPVDHIRERLRRVDTIGLIVYR